MYTYNLVKNVKHEVYSMFNLGPVELIIILIIVLLLFGGKKLPELTRSIGEGIKNIRKGFSESTETEKTSKSSKKKQD